MVIEEMLGTLDKSVFVIQKKKKSQFVTALAQGRGG